MNRFLLSARKVARRMDLTGYDVGVITTFTYSFWRFLSFTEDEQEFRGLMIPIALPIVGITSLLWPVTLPLLITEHVHSYVNSGKKEKEE